jgi:hypothetical protein
MRFFQDALFPQSARLSADNLDVQSKAGVAIIAAIIIAQTVEAK